MRFSLLVGVFCVWGRFLCPWFSAILVHGAPAWPHLLSSRGLLRPEPPAPGEHQGPSAGGGGQSWPQPSGVIQLPPTSPEGIPCPLLAWEALSVGQRTLFWTFDGCSQSCLLVVPVVCVGGGGGGVESCKLLPSVSGALTFSAPICPAPPGLHPSRPPPPPPCPPPPPLSGAAGQTAPLGLGPFPPLSCPELQTQRLPFTHAHPHRVPPPRADTETRSSCKGASALFDFRFLGQLCRERGCGPTVSRAQALSAGRRGSGGRRPGR